METREIIEKLPVELQPIASKYLPFFVEAAEDEIVAWVEAILAGNWEAAYQAVLQKMSNEDLAAEQEKITARLKDLNTESLERQEAQKQIIRDLLKEGLMVLRAYAAR